MTYGKNNEVDGKDEKNLIDAWRDTNARLAGVFTALVLAIFPLLFHDRYADILVFKYRCYFVSVIVLAVLMLFTALFFLHKDARWYDWKYTKQLKTSMHIKNLKAVDWAMIVFVMAAVISTFQSEYFYESFWGNEGRYSGLFLILMYGISFFIVSKCLRFKRIYLDAFLGGGIIASCIGILHFFRIDPLRLKEGLSYGSDKIFLSTIGNVNTYTAYLAMLAGVGIVLFIAEKPGKKKMFYMISALLSLFSMIAANSDNTYISFGILFGLLPLYLFSDFYGIKHYLLIVSSVATEIFVIGGISRSIPTHVMEVDGIFPIISRLKILPVIIVVLWVITFILYKQDKKKELAGRETCICKAAKIIWEIILIFVIISVCLVLADANIWGHAERYSALKNYVVFNDEWGTVRGYVWRIALESYHNFPIIHKIFGHGPDTFGIITTQNYLEEMGPKYNQIFENAHNEYIQYLLTIGIVGLGAYIALLAAAFKQLLKKEAYDPSHRAIAFALACYVAQASVNINVLIVTVVMLTLLMAGMAESENKDKMELALEKENTEEMKTE